MARTPTAAVDRAIRDEKLNLQSPPDTLPRATHKAKRVEDRRQNVWSA